MESLTFGPDGLTTAEEEEEEDEDDEDDDEDAWLGGCIADEMKNSLLSRLSKSIPLSDSLSSSYILITCKYKEDNEELLLEGFCSIRPVTSDVILSL